MGGEGSVQEVFWDGLILAVGLGLGLIFDFGWIGIWCKRFVPRCSIG